MDTYYYIPPYETDPDEMMYVDYGVRCISFFMFTFIVAVVVFILMKNY